MVMLVFMVIGLATFFVSSLNSATLRIKQDEVTVNALAEAKEALIGRAASDSTTPGQLPCPENTALIGSPNEGQALGSCTLPAIGRLPWKTLGLGDLRDANGDKLWYALSDGFRTPPLNSDTPALLTVDGVTNKAVAIIFSPGPPINGQSRPDPTSSTPPDVNQYLELSNNTGSNTFVSSGPSDSFNDKLLIVTHDDLFRVVERRVAKEVVNALNEYFCGVGNVNPAGGCVGAGGNRFYPLAADFSDAACLGTGSLATCNSGTSNGGRVPANPSTAWDSLSILDGTNASNWFRANAWREVIFYAVAPACTFGTSNCNGAGYLTLNNPSGAVAGTQKVVILAAGAAFATQTRATKTLLSDYLEDENLAPLDDTYTKSVANPATPFNDIAIGIP